MERQYSHYYMAENRTYGGYDATLETGPYNFGWLSTKPNTVEHFPYQDGLLVWYWDTQYQTTTPAPTWVAARHCRSTPAPRR
ncbi:MAG TPA: hypothetical protein VGD51_18665 [Nocardioidaceae bacterium]